MDTKVVSLPQENVRIDKIRPIKNGDDWDVVQIRSINLKRRVAKLPGVLLFAEVGWWAYPKKELIGTIQSAHRVNSHSLELVVKKECLEEIG